MFRAARFLFIVAIAGWLSSPSPAQSQELKCEPGQAAQKYPNLSGKRIKMGADPQTPPYIMRDATNFENIVGIDADLARYVFDCAGIKVDIVLGAWSGLLPAVQSGQLDIMWNDLFYRPARAKVVDFVIYMQAATAALVPVDNPKKIDAIAKFCGATVSFAIGSSVELVVKKQDEACKAANQPAVVTMPFQDLASGLRLLDSGRADAILWDLGYIEYLVANNPNKYAKAFSLKEGYKVGVGVRKGNKELLQLIYNGIRIAQRDGVQRKIFQKYGVDPALELAPEILTE
jgi:polar amino acid transport system substrate-binding protein